VLPSYRRRGIGASILRESERRARARLDDVDAPTVYMVTWADAWHSDAGALFNRLGLQAARHFFTMEYDRPSVPDPDVPPGYTIRVFDPEREARDAWRVIDTAFRDHWGYYGTPYESWREWYLGDWMDPGLCRVAVASDGELAGASMCYIDPEENERLGRQRGWIEDLGVLRSHRRRGLGRALLLASMRGLRARGCTHLTLGVDTHNPTGALALYRSVGFRVCSQSSIYRKRLRGPD
jgi:mycothiol synthase